VPGCKLLLESLLAVSEAVISPIGAQPRFCGCPFQRLAQHFLEFVCFVAQKAPPYLGALIAAEISAGQYFDAIQDDSFESGIYCDEVGVQDDYAWRLRVSDANLALGKVWYSFSGVGPPSSGRHSSNFVAR
jgi:hypothetical protein